MRDRMTDGDYAAIDARNETGELREARRELARHLTVCEATADYVDNHHQRSDDPEFDALQDAVEKWRLENERLLKLRKSAP